MTTLLKGAEVSKALNLKIKKEVEELKKKGITPCLAMVRVGGRPDDISYEKGATKRCETLGVEPRHITLPEDVSEEKLLEVIAQCNTDKEIHGILLFRPLPKHLNEEKICDAIAVEKDVDGIKKESLTGVFTGSGEGFAPCTPKACMEMLDYYGIDCTGKKAVVIGRSLVVGKPAAMMLLEKNATVTICHSRTENLEEICKQADIIVAAAGSMRMLGKEAFREGQIILDVGIHVDSEGKLCGDVKFEEAEGIVEAITPVPGGVGAVTNGVLCGNVVTAANRQENQE